MRSLRVVIPRAARRTRLHGEERPDIVAIVLIVVVDITIVRVNVPRIRC